MRWQYDQVRAQMRTATRGAVVTVRDDTPAAPVSVFSSEHCDATLMQSVPVVAQKPREKSLRVQRVLADAGYYPDRKGKTFGQLRDIVIRNIGGYESPREKGNLKRMIQRLYEDH
jgi:hypothetical protein